MRIEWLTGFGWNTTGEFSEDIDIILMERGIAIEYWFQSLKDKTIKHRRKKQNAKS